MRAKLPRQPFRSATIPGAAPVRNRRPRERLEAAARVARVPIKRALKPLQNRVTSLRAIVVMLGNREAPTPQMGSPPSILRFRHGETNFLFRFRQVMNRMRPEILTAEIVGHLPAAFSRWASRSPPLDRVQSVNQGTFAVEIQSRRSDQRSPMAYRCACRKRKGITATCLTQAGESAGRPRKYSLTDIKSRRKCFIISLSTFY